MAIMKIVRGCCFFQSFFSFIPLPVLCETRHQVLWGNWLHNQTFPNFEHFDARSSAVIGEEGWASASVGVEIFLYLDC